MKPGVREFLRSTTIRSGSRLIWLAAATGFFWLGIMFVLAMSDFETRGWE